VAWHSKIKENKPLVARISLPPWLEDAFANRWGQERFKFNGDLGNSTTHIFRELLNAYVDCNLQIISFPFFTPYEKPQTAS
jgi:hypothetical protein